MKLYLVAVVLFVALASLIEATPAKNRNPPCIKICTDDYTPVCAGVDGEKPISFGNECVMRNYNCEQHKELKKISEGECPGGGGVRLQ
ncbi:vasotab [Ctenocephalides felis]|uniref:vasotab n=1 Tax=Ctenocephalides felis TaxID=7515 RepID=UPI000E6E52FB|nr:vasotab [Ctenocephalides felis]